VRRIREGPPAGAFTTTTVLQLLLHCEPSAAIAALDARRNATDVEVASDPSTSGNCPKIMLICHFCDFSQIDYK